MKLELSLPKNAFVLGEHIDVDVRVVNTGSEAVELPLPSSPSNSELTYTLGGPAYPESTTFSYRSVRSARRPAEAAPVVRTLEPGGLFEHGFRLGEWMTVTEPGAYTIEARLRWRGIDVRSERLTFQLEGHSFRSAGIGVDVGTGSGRAVRIAWLGSSKERQTIGSALVQEKRPDLGESQTQAIRSLRAVGPGAKEPMMPWTNRDRSETLISWLAWLENSRLMAWTRTEAPPQEFDLGESHLIAPVLQTPGGELNAVTLSADGAGISLVRFGPEPAVIAEATLPVRVSSGRAVLGPEPASRSHVILVGQQGNAVIMHHWVADAKSTGPVRTIKIPNASLPASSQPALRVDEKGRTHAAVLLSRDQGGSTSVLRAVFPRDESPEVDAKVTPLPALPGKIKSSVAAFDVSGPTVSDPFWVVELNSGELIHSNNPSVRQPMGPNLAQPIQFLRRSQASYVLMVDPVKGPSLVSLQ